MKKSDHQLGMERDISRREFIQDISLASLGLSLSSTALAKTLAGNPQLADAYYPPVLTGMRGSHPGAFEVAHALARFDYSQLDATGSPVRLRRSSTVVNVAIDEAFRAVGDLKGL